MQLDLSVVPRLAERQAAGALVDAREAINDQRNEACKHLYAASAKRMEEYRQEIEPLRKLMDLARTRLNADMQVIDDQIAELSRPFLERMDVIDDEIAEQHPDVLTNEDGEARCCSVTGLVLLEDDELWEHLDHGVALMALFHPDTYSRDQDVANSAIPDVVAA